jgi:hypothetical protein
LSFCFNALKIIAGKFAFARRWIGIADTPDDLPRNNYGLGRLATIFSARSNYGTGPRCERVPQSSRGQKVNEPGKTNWESNIAYACRLASLRFLEHKDAHQRMQMPDVKSKDRETVSLVSPLFAAALAALSTALNAGDFFPLV